MPPPPSKLAVELERLPETVERITESLPTPKHHQAAAGAGRVGRVTLQLRTVNILVLDRQRARPPRRGTRLPSGLW